MDWLEWNRVGVVWNGGWVGIEWVWVGMGPAVGFSLVCCAW